MNVLSAAYIIVGAAAGYAATRQLLEREDLPSRVPAPLRPPLLELRARLRLARQRARMVIEEADRERRRAEAELLADYYRRVGRPQQAPPLPPSMSGGLPPVGGAAPPPGRGPAPPRRRL